VKVNFTIEQTMKA